MPFIVRICLVHALWVSQPYSLAVRMKNIFESGQIHLKEPEDQHFAILGVVNPG